MTSAPIFGAGMIIATVVMESAVIALATGAIARTQKKLCGFPLFFRTVCILSALSLWLLFAGIGCALWLWSALLVGLGEFNSFADAMYFTSVSATTLGYGDSLLSSEHQLLSGFIAANGLLLFSLNTAFLFEALRRINETENKK